VLEVFDRVERDPDGRVLFHHVIVDYACRAIGGALGAADDAAELVLADPADLSGWALTPIARRVIARAVAPSR
jgi:hypothetical protein